MSSDKSPQNLFNEALARQDATERARFLDEACGTDAALRERLERLLRAHDEAGGFFSQPSKVPSSGSAPGSNTPRLTEKPGDRIGRYKLLQQIGEGGCGVVYMAEQEEPVRRRVALKVIKLGMDTKQVIARFEAERQALAMMDHPNIARVLDAGATDSGRPFFVMELVRGKKITEFCDEKELSTPERLDLFLEACSAIQHAHQKGVIHRDIKPSNILVTVIDGTPVPKVIDFGIAKATNNQPLTDKTLFTAFEQFIGTPAYMSPEQAELSGVDIDTRTDIYSLGVVLYELLTGGPPFDQKQLLASGLDAMRRTIREEAPPRPSNRLSTMGADALTTTAHHRHTEPPKLLQLVRGDLDWIAMKCLEKDRARRYETANALAADIRRHLENEPVVARPPSRLYEFQKTVRRHKFGFAAAGAIIMVLAIGLAVSMWQFVQKNHAYQRASAAEQEQSRLRQQAELAANQEAQQRQRAEQLAEQNRQNLYAARINQAQHVFEEGDVARVMEILDSLEPKPGSSDLRGFEWYYLWGLCHSERFNLIGHDGPVRSVAFSPDGVTLASAGNDMIIRLWDARTGKQKAALDGNSGWVTSLAFSPDGKWLAAGSSKNTVGLWEIATEKLTHTFEGHTNPVSVVKFSPDGNLLVSATADTPTGSGTPQSQFLGSMTAVGELRLWNLKTMKESATLPEQPRGILDLAFSPDGKMLVTGGTDQILKLWDITTRKELASQTNFTGPIFAIAFAPGGKLLATAGGYPHNMSAEIKFWDLAGFKELPLLHEELPLAFSATFTPDGKSLIVAGKDQVIRLVNLASGRTCATFRGHKTFIWRVTLAPDGQTLASADWSGVVKIWDPTETQERKAFAGDEVGAYSLAFSPDGKLLAAGGQRVQGAAVWDVGTGKQCLADSMEDANAIVAISGDGATLAAAGSEGVVQLWNLRTFEPQRSIPGHVRKIWSMAFSPDHQTLAIGGETDAIEIWDYHAGTMRASLKGHTGFVRNLAFTPDGRTLASGSMTELKLWDMETASAQTTLPGPNQVLNISPNGRILASGSLASGIILRTLPELKVLVTLRGHKNTIWDVTFSPDSKTVATASWDATVKLWHVATGQELLSFNAGGGVAWRAVFSPDLRLLAFGSGSVRKGEIALVRAAAEEDLQKAQATERAAAAERNKSAQARAESAARERVLSLRARGQANDPQLDQPLVKLTQLLIDAQKYAEAEDVARESLALREKIMPDQWVLFNTRSVLGGILVERKKYAEAEPLLLSGYEGLKQQLDTLPIAGKSCLSNSLDRLVRLYEALEKPDQAAEWNKKLAEFAEVEAEK